MNPLHKQSNVSWISNKAELEILSMKTRLEKWVWESGPKIDPATSVRAIGIANLLNTVGSHNNHDQKWDDNIAPFETRM